MNLDGTNSGVDIPDLTFPGDFTVAAWVYLRGTVFVDDILIGQDSWTGQAINFCCPQLRLYDGSSDVIVSSSNVLADTWTHCVLTRTGGTLNLYLDGALDATSSGFTNTLTVEFIGRTAGASTDGLIDEMYLYGRALDATEIQDLFNTSGSSDTEAPTVPTGLSSSNITGTSFTLSWAASADSVGVTGYEVFQDGDSIGTTATTSFDVTGLTCGTTYAMTVRAQDAAANWSAQSTSSDITTTDCTSSLIGYWSFDETSGSTASDGSGNGNDGTLLGNATFATGKLGNAVNLDGTNSGVDIPDLTFPGDFTVAAWVYLRGTVFVDDILIGQDSWTGQAINFCCPQLRLYDGSSDVIVSSSNVLADTWTHCVLTRTGGTLNLYLDGALDATSSGFTNTLTVEFIGRTAGASTDGLIDEMYLYGRALDATEIQDLFNTSGSSDTEAPTVPTGLSSSNITGTSFTLSWAASADSVGVTGYEVFQDGDSIGTTATTSFDVTGLSCGTMYTMTVRAQDAAANWSAQSTSSDITTTDCTSSLIGYWSFDETSGSTASDGSGNGNDGTLLGNATFATGKLGNAVNLDGTNSGVDIPDLTFPGDFTVAAWVYLRGTVFVDDILIGQDSWTGQAINFCCPQLRLYDGSSDVIVSSSNVLADTWTHCVLTRTGGTLNLYLDGALDATSSGFTNTLTVEFIGRTAGASTDGLIDEMYLYGRALDATEIQDLFNTSGSSDIEAPTVPTGLSSSNITGTSFTLSWTASADSVGVTGYEVFQNGDSIGTTATTSFDVTGLSCGTTYAMTVRAQDAAANWSSQSPAQNVLTSACGGPVTVNDFLAGSYNGIAYRLFVPENYDPSTSYPLVLFLHGAGERGNDNISQVNEWPLLFAQDSNQVRWPSFVLVPQCPIDQQWVDVPWANGSYSLDTVPISPAISNVHNLLGQLQSTYNLDATRLYVTGLSMGGFGTWDIITRFPDAFAAAIACCGAGDPGKASLIKDIPIRFYHSDDDLVVPVGGSRDMNVALTNASAIDAVYKEYTGWGHASWIAAYNEPGLLPWLYAQVNSPTFDIIAPSVPTGLASSNVGATKFTLSWAASTDSVGVTGYEVFQDGDSIGTSATTSFDVTGLSCGTNYAMTVRAGDAAANWSAQSPALNVSTSACSVGDTIAPTVPTGLSSSNLTGTSFTLSWAASTDSVGVTGYEVFQDGDSIGTTATTSFDVTGLTCGTTYAMTVRAQDAAANWSAQSTSSDITTTDCTSSLIGYWSFDETSGSTASDGSGNGNDGTLLGNATFATGKLGNAVNLDGTNSGVDIPDLTFPGDFTVAAWVYLRGTVFVDDILIGQDSWTGQAINFCCPQLRLYDGSSDVIVSSSNVLADTWTHCVLTRTGGTLNLYLDGALDATSSGFTNTLTVEFIGRTAGASTDGLIDEMYLYGRALDATEIQDLFNTSGSSDTEAPTVPTGLSSSNITGTSFTLSWAASADSVGVTGYEVFQDGDSIGTTATTSFDVMGLTCGTTYAMTVRAGDAAANWSAQSSARNVSTSACSVGDTIAPTVPTGLSSSSITGTSFTLSWAASADSVGVTGYEVFQDGDSIGATATTSFDVTGLSPSTTYAMTVRARDAVSNWSAQSSALNVTTTTQQTTTRGKQCWCEHDWLWRSWFTIGWQKKSGKMPYAPVDTGLKQQVI